MKHFCCDLWAIQWQKACTASRQLPPTPSRPVFFPEVFPLLSQGPDLPRALLGVPAQTVTLILQGLQICKHSPGLQILLSSATFRTALLSLQATQLAVRGKRLIKQSHTPVLMNKST